DRGSQTPGFSCSPATGLRLVKAYCQAATFDNTIASYAVSFWVEPCRGEGGLAGVLNKECRYEHCVLPGPRNGRRRVRRPFDPLGRGTRARVSLVSHERYGD